MRDSAKDENLSWLDVNAISAELGDAFYLLEDNIFEGNYHALLNEFQKNYPKTAIGYSYKTNYTPYLCRRILDLGGYAEVVSEMEWDLARRIGVPGNRVIFNGPYKSARAFNDALLAGSIINLDNSRDLRLLQESARQHQGKSFGVALRCNFEIDPHAVSRFGFDISGDDFLRAQEVISELKNVELVGLHCHFPNRDVPSYTTRVRRILSLVDNVFVGKHPRFVNVGGGFFGEMPERLKQSLGVEAASFGDYSNVIARGFAEHFGVGPGCPELIIEPGTALVANAMKFFCQVLDLRRIRGRKFATVAGSIFNISPVARNTNLPARIIRKNELDGNGREEFDIVGYTCIEGDVLSARMEGRISVGDFVEYSNLGSYSIVMKPPFILPNFPIIRFDDVKSQQKWVIVKKAETVDYLFENFLDYSLGERS